MVSEHGNCEPHDLQNLDTPEVCSAAPARRFMTGGGYKKCLEITWSWRFHDQIFKSTLSKTTSFPGKERERPKEGGWGEGVRNRMFDAHP